MPNNYLDGVTINGTEYELRDVSAQEQIANKANDDGYYESMTVGQAEQLVSTVGIEDKVPYNFRTSGGTADIGDREEDMVVGGSLAWNQLVKNGNFDGTTNWSASAASISASNNVLTLTKNANTGAGVGYARQVGFSFTVGHKYLARVDYKAASGDSLTLFSNSSNAGMIQISEISDEDWHTFQKIFSVTAAPSVPAILGLNTITTDDTRSVQFRNYNIFDLTQMFGSTIADYIYSLETTTPGAGVAWFRKLFPKPYYAYDAGTLMSVQTSAHNMTGFNQWDEEWESGYITNGVPTAWSGRIRSKNFTQVIPGATYYIYCGANEELYVVTYDGNKNYIGQQLKRNGTFTMSERTHYIKLWIAGQSSYANDICINLSWDGERDGEYEPYELHSYPLDDSLTLRGIPKLDASNQLYYDGDTYESDGTVTRKYGIVDLGTFTTWAEYGGYPGLFYVNASPSGAKIPASNSVKPNIVCDSYLAAISRDIGTTGHTKGEIALATNRIYVSNDTYSGNVAGFKSAIQGVYLVYELATPTTETADPFQTPQIVNDFGTEEYVDAPSTASTPTRDVAIPVGHETYYQNNLRAKLEMAPDSPGDGDGDYIVRQTNGINEYVPLVIPAELPTNPSEDGNYVLKATVTNGTTVLSWEAQS